MTSAVSAHKEDKAQSDKNLIFLNFLSINFPYY